MKRVLRFIVWLYPAPWRQRYGAEFVHGQTATLSAYRSELTDVIGQALSQESLLAIMEKENLYQTERANKPMDDVINKMRQSVRIVAKDADAIEVSFDCAEAVRAQQTTRDLVAKLIDELLRRNERRSSSANPLTSTLQRFEIFDEPSMPQRPVSPKRGVITSWGLAVGILLGAVATWVRRPTAAGVV